jgi:hypothetical protein
MINDTLSATTLAVPVMDCSTSMRRFKDEPRTLLNRMIRQLQAARGAPATFLAVFGFNRLTHLLIKPQPLMLVTPIETIELNRGTRLYGTVAEVLTQAIEFRDDRAKVGHKPNILVSVFTDGENTLSQDSISDARRLAKEARRRDIQLDVIGLGVDGRQIARHMGFSGDSSIFGEATSDSLNTSIGLVAERTTTIMGLGAGTKKSLPN